LLYEAEGKVFWTRVRLPPGPPIKEFMNTGLIAFLIFWVVFGIGYLTRDKSKEEEKLRHFGH
jgi:succinate dehydrogenase/fumarate reductase cytochrome b subunit